ncbi:hypothetical protein WN944_009531 [Citrus x changshan-huyou]|uniref:Uncharacterized protein n=1 Tax=Citrus x changshan-huyou TaxID=2935761 RepID=A0AAP0MSC3_9ROSI
MARALLHLNSTATAIMARATSATTETVLDGAQFQMKNQNGRVLVFGGTGRVGGSTAVALYKLCPNIQIVVGFRNRQHTLMFVTIPATLSLQSSSKVKAIVANIPAITSEGIYPGVSNGTFMNILVLQSALLASYTPLMNKLGGRLPQTFAKSCVLTSLNLNRNRLEGPMPPSLVNCRHYKLVYVLFME